MLRIAQIAPLWVPVPPRTYGGIELMLTALTEELVKRGHDVSLFASGDSRTSGRLIPATDQALWSRKDLRSPHAVIVRMMKMVYDRRKQFDLIHNHFDFFMYPLLINNGTPILTTLHRPIDDELARAARSFPKMNFCAISYDQKQRAEEKGLKIKSVVYNGIKPPLYPFKGESQNYFLYLSRLNREKGIVEALEIAEKSGVKLVVAGNIVSGDEWHYFFQEVQPRLNAKNVQFVGEVDFTEKTKLLSNAKALLFPIDRDEPFGLVMIEAMACGTPVIAYRRGSVPEVVEDGKTGFIVEDKDGMMEAMKRVNELDRACCRKRVEENFTLDRMVDSYESLYQSSIKKE